MKDVFAGAVGSATLASCVIDSDGRVMASSRAFADLLDLSPSAAVGRQLVELMEGWERSDSLSDAVTLVRDRNGSLQVVEVRGTPLQTGGGDMIALQDVTIHHEARMELAELAQFPNKNPGPVVWLDREATVLRANPAAARIFGEHLVGDLWLNRCPGMNETVWEAVLDTSEPFVRDADLPGGCYSMSYLSSDDGRFVFSFGSDITTVREAERKLAEIARFPDMNPGPVLRLDMSGSILLANRAARDLFGEETTGSCWLDIVPEIAARWDEICGSSEPVPIETRHGERDFQFTHRHDEEAELVFVFGADITDQKRAERGIQQADRMATLGTLAAGIAHELNNPAAAARRAADQMRDAFGKLQEAQRQLDLVAIDDRARDLMRSIDEIVRVHSERPTDLNAVERSDREVEIEDWLDDHDISDESDLAPMLVALGISADSLDGWANEATEGLLEPILAWAAAVFPVYRLAHEMGQATSRISEIVGAMRSYSYLGQAPLQEVDLHDGIDNTLVILRNKLKVGVDVKRNYSSDLPKVPAYGGELNQVWTNLLDNAADAMNGIGEITITTSRDAGFAVVEILDNGPGIPAESVDRIFDPFFTTKDPGKGTGLGLATTYAIVTEKHKGNISVTSEPGRTCFTIRLPLGQES